VKRIFLLTAVMLVWSSSLVAGELKVMVPVDEFKQLKLRLEAIENENNRLRQELSAMKTQERPAPANVEIQTRLETVEKENRQLKEAQARQDEKKSSGGDDAGLTVKLNAAENENSKLQQEVKLLKEGGISQAYAANKIAAREQYFIERRKGASHVYKF
jgi:hypothetical protein